ncbi:MAG TPA: DUF1592 domain-containing protein, partial [Bryobacteraceae bacterium]|nr:DUF1592 domain-containing protein [Bryobacteraceae bacterium]
MLVAASFASAADSKPTLASQFTATVRPFIESYCIGCHSGAKAMAQFDLKKYSTLATVIEDHAHWATVLEKLSAKEMPPPQMKQPPTEARQRVIDWITALRKEEARKNAGDPGVVLARRLSNAEYNYTIRDLTGVDIRPTREFPVDPANPAGFDNSGESLGMSPALVTKYLQAAREVADHMLLRPSGIAFAPHPMLVETDRDKYCVKQIVDFYQRQNTDYSDYFRVAWMYKHRVVVGQPNATLSSLAAANHMSEKYLATIWRTLEVAKENAGPVAKLQSMWRELPTPKGKQPELGRAGCDRMRDFVVQLRRKIQPTVTNLTAKGISNTAQPFLIWRNNQYAANRLKFDPAVLQVEGEARKAAPVAALKKEMTDNDAEEEPAPKVVAKPTGPDPDLQVPAGQRARYEAAFARFAAVFPDAFYVSERGRYFPDNTRDKGRHLSAGFHNLMGYYRDDGPLYDLILDEKGRKELDALWHDMDFVASANIRTYVQFYMFESKEAAKGAAEDKEITSEPRIRRVKENYLARAKAAGSDVAAKAIDDHFEAVNAGVRWVERERAAAEPRHLDALEKFASRAYRRSLSNDERNDLRAYYRALRETDGLSHEEAIRESIVSILMSPDFCYRVDLVEASATKGRAQPLSDTALASRLSYFLWSSMPDEKLLARAATGTLRNPVTLAAEARRMLKDQRARGLATEFGGNWLDIRRFEEINTVDRERFPTFDNALRQAMFE